MKIPEHREWLDANARRFEEKWGWLPPPIVRYRRKVGADTWHFCQNCPNWPVAEYEEAAPANEYRLDAPPTPPGGLECDECSAS